MGSTPRDRSSSPRLSGPLSLQRLVSRFFPSPASPEASRLLTEKELAEIRVLAARPDAMLPGAVHESRGRLLGERLAAFTGSGLEFAEHRAFQVGDQPRFINWRLYGRTGQLYVRRFQEERREQLFLLVDRRHDMWFGTHRRLKVARAVAQAVYLASLAAHRQLAVGAVMLDQQASWSACRQGPGHMASLLHALNISAQAVDARTPTVGLNMVLEQVALRIEPGSVVVLISDFHDLDNKSVPLLYALAQQHALVACHVQDVVEYRLPTQGHYYIADETRPNMVHRLDCDDAPERARWQAQLDASNAATREWLEHGGARYLRCLTTDDWQDLPVSGTGR